MERTCASCPKTLALSTPGDLCRSCNARRLGSALGKSGAGHRAMPKGSEPRRRAGRNGSQTRMGWCPLEYRPLYNYLVYSRNFPAAEARQMVEQQVAADLARYARTGQLQQARRL